MPVNPRLLKKLNDPKAVAAAGRKAILREEYNSLRNEIRSVSAALLNNPAPEYIAGHCTALHDLLNELQELALQMLADKASSETTKKTGHVDS